MSTVQQAGSRVLRFRPITAVLLLLLLPTGCTQDRDRSVDERAVVARIRTVAEGLRRQQTEVAWHGWVSGAAANSTTLYQGRRWLFAPSTIDLVRRVLRTETTGDGRRALHFLHAFLVGEYIKHDSSEIADQIAQTELRRFEFDGEELQFRNLSNRLALESDPLERRRLAEAALPIVRELNVELRQMHLRFEKAAARLGYASSIAAASEIRQLNPRAAADLAEQVLTTSDALYLSALRELGPAEVGVELKQMRPVDSPRLNASARFSTLFPPERMIPALDETSLALGIDLSQLPIRIDARSRPGKDPRAASFAIEIPDDIRLSIMPIGGAGDYAHLLHEMGHALHFAHTRTQIFEFQHLGDNALGEAFAFLMESLLENPTWLEEQLSMKEPELTEYVRLAALRKLYMVRRYAGRLLYELSWSKNTAAARKKAYTQQMSRAYGFSLDEVDAERYLVDRDPLLATADYVRGWLLAAQIEAVLTERFGKRWWAAPGAGELLRELWAPGQRDRCEDLARRLGIEKLGPEALMRRAAEALVRPPPRMRSAAAMERL